MDYARLGRTGLKVSRLCLGTMNFGPLTAEPESFAIMDRALALGIDFFDTADVYGWRTGEGVTETSTKRSPGCPPCTPASPLPGRRIRAPSLTPGGMLTT